MSPKSVALPVVAITTDSIALKFVPPPSPPAKNPDILFDVPAKPFLAAPKSPKSEALPVLAIVIYCITFTAADPLSDLDTKGHQNQKHYLQKLL